MKSHDIKDILEGRRIEVSENSWEKLSEKLDANDQKKKRNRFYLPYAACLALLVGWFVFVLLKSEQVVSDTEIVNQEKTSKSTIVKEKETPKIIIPQNEQQTPQSIQQTQIAVEEHVKEKVKVEEAATELQTKKELAVELQKEVQQSVAIQEKVIPQKIETVIENKDAVVDQDANLKESILALLKEEKVTVTNAEIDLLLQQAQKSLKELDVKENINPTNFATADELLNEVEYELDMSFKQRVFEIVKRNINRTRTADIDQ
jgi:hypothetical protein